MKTLDSAIWGWLLLVGIVLSAWHIPLRVYAQTPSPELIVDICTNPHKYWNKFVMVKGHVRSVTANPPGTNRGSYVLRDSSDQDLTVLTSELPAPGKEYSVSGNVEQVSPDARVPVLREFRRVVGGEPLPQAAPPRRSASAEEPAPVRRREPAAPAAAAPAAPQVKEVQPVVIHTVPAPETSSASTPLVIAIAGLAVLLAIVLVVLVMRPKPAAVPAQPAFRSTQVPTGAPAPIRPPAPPPPSVARAASPPSSSVPTQVVPPPAAKGTEVYLNLGAALSVSEGPDRGKQFNLTKPIITMGRAGARQNDITLGDSTVSRDHAKIIYSTADKTFRLINESTTNPARVNGNAIDSVLLNDGDTIQLGATAMKFSKT